MLNQLPRKVESLRRGTIETVKNHPIPTVLIGIGIGIGWVLLNDNGSDDEYKENVMPYSSLKDLPDSVRDNLPKHAQEIYKSAFNSAWDEYADPSDRRGDADREETAHKVAWSAVKKKYEKNNGQWVKKEE